MITRFGEINLFKPVRNKRDYARMQRVVVELLAVVAETESHPLNNLLSAARTLIAEYEEEV